METDIRKPSIEGQKQEDYEAHWPASLAEIASPKLSERSCLERAMWRAIEEDA